jgi:hypothetical protein
MGKASGVRHGVTGALRSGEETLYQFPDGKHGDSRPVAVCTVAVGHFQ